MNGAASLCRFASAWWRDGALVLRLLGAKAAITAAQQTIGGEEIAGDDFWLALREQSNEFFTRSKVFVAHCSLPSSRRRWHWVNN